MIEVRGRKIVYLDNAATSLPKPRPVIEAITEALLRAGNPGRSGHSLSHESMRDVFEARESLASLLRTKESRRIILTGNATWALNIALKGTLCEGDHVVTSVMEHNSVLRPLRTLRDRGVSVTFVEGDETGRVDPLDVARSIRNSTKLVALMHASNVTGAINNVEVVGTLCREKDLLFLVDASQSAGILDIDVEKMSIDLLASSGHKSLFGPQGTGFLFVGERAEVAPLIEGGTGSRSENDRHPMFLPDRLEAGTINSPGMAGLRRGVDYVMERGVESVWKHERALVDLTRDGLSSIPRVRVYGPARSEDMVGVVLFNVEGIDPGELSLYLEDEYGLLVRPGLHCAPLAHRLLGTFPEGAVRVSFSIMNSMEDGEQIIRAVRSISEKH